MNRRQIEKKNNSGHRARNSGKSEKKDSHLPLLRTGIYFTGFVVIVAGMTLWLWAADKDSSFVKKQLGTLGPQKEPRLTLKEQSFDFGKISQEKEVKHTFTFTNTGDKTLKIKGIDTSCGCMAGLASSKTVKPKKSGRIRVTLDPIGKKGKITKTVTVYSNDSEEPEKQIYIYATVEHKVDVHSDLQMERVLFFGKCRSCHADRAESKTGKALYDAICAYCHGEDGKGKSADPFKPRSDSYICNWVAYGKAGSGMAGYSKARGGPLDNNQIDSLVTHVRNLVP